MKVFLEKLFSRCKEIFKSEEGFSLMEIMIVLVIIGIIGAIAVPQLLKLPDQAKVTAAKAQIKELGVPLQRYNMQVGNYPSSDEGWQAVMDAGIINEIPKDPWNNEYIYISPADNGAPYDIISLGADGTEGGEGYSADISGAQ